MKINASIIDAHAHCGILDRFPDQSYESYAAHAEGSGIGAVVMFSPVMEIYDRYDPDFKDTRQWQEKRRLSNDYLLTIGSDTLQVIPYFFIWNDFAVDQLTPRHFGIKWHRHADEPVYHYDDPKCSRAVDEIKKRGLPIVFEEELDYTVDFINRIAGGVRVIIPHLGGLNGGYRAIAGNRLWENPTVYTDTALASAWEIMDYIDHYGHDRIFFGSDFPFGHPAMELKKIEQLKLTDTIREKILSGNLKRLLASVQHTSGSSE